MTAVDSEALRAEAERILSGPRYRTDPTFAEQLSEWWAELLYQFFAFLDWVAGLVGGPVVFGAIVLGLVVVTTILITRNLGRRRAREVEDWIRREHALARGLDPADLERAANQAARDGDHAESVRLRFQAGLLRLDEGGRIRFQPGLTTADVAEMLDSPEFVRLAERFDEIVYGHRPAGPTDDLEARHGWERVLGVVMVG